MICKQIAQRGVEFSQETIVLDTVGPLHTVTTLRQIQQEHSSSEGLSGDGFPRG